MGNGFSNRPRAVQIAIVIGVACVLLGAWRLLSALGVGLWSAVWRVLNAVGSVLWPFALVCVGVGVLWAAFTGRLKTAIERAKARGGLRRSRADRRIAGVCGGIARTMGIEPSAVRVFAIALFVVSPPVATIAYLAVAVLASDE